MKVVGEKEWVKAHYEIAALINFTADELSVRLGTPFIDYDVDGLGRARGQNFSLPDGRQFYFEQLLQAPEPGNMMTSINCRDGNLERDLIDILKALKLKPEDVIYLQQGIDAKKVAAAFHGSCPSPSPRP